MTHTLDETHLRRWIGAEESAEEVLTPALAERFHATLGLPGDPPRQGEAAPRLIHFCLCQAAAPMAALAEDGHPVRGGFLPPVPLPRRMWAASEIDFSGDLMVGDSMHRHSRIADVSVKQGRSGALCFVTIEHVIDGGGAACIRDRQTIVYRAAETTSVTAPAPEPAPRGASTVTIDPTPLLLFRYSALTFNGHRIHYDQAYATDVEGYPGLVVHGPLQATLLFHLAARAANGRAPDRFSFRSAAPLFHNDAMDLHCGAPTDKKLDLWTARPGGPFAMRAEAEWA